MINWIKRKWKWFVGLLTVAVAVPLLLGGGPEIKGEADAYRLAISSQIQAFQDDYFINNGRYWQGLETTSKMPKDGVKEDIQIKSTTDYAEKWSDTGIVMPQDASFSTRVDVYEGPKGWGYVITTSFIDGDVLWEKSENFGPETHKDHDWIMLKP